MVESSHHGSSPILGNGARIFMHLFLDVAPSRYLRGAHMGRLCLRAFIGLNICALMDGYCGGVNE